MTGRGSTWHAVLDEYERVLERRTADFGIVSEGGVIDVEPIRFESPPGELPPDCVDRARALRRATEELVRAVAAAADDLAPARPVPRRERSAAASTFDRRV